MKGLTIPARGQSAPWCAGTKKMVIMGDPLGRTVAGRGPRRDACALRTRPTGRSRGGLHAGAAIRHADDISDDGRQLSSPISGGIIGEYLAFALPGHR